MAPCPERETGRRDSTGRSSVGTSCTTRATSSGRGQASWDGDGTSTQTMTGWSNLVASSSGSGMDGVVHR
jgi:hypothetical protein